jgi:hypothetical protein
MSTPIIEKGQCSRCLFIQYVDTSESCAFKCENCDEIDVGYFDEDIIKDFEL